MEPHKNTMNMGIRKKRESGSSPISQASKGRFQAMAKVVVFCVSRSETTEGSAISAASTAPRVASRCPAAPRLSISPGTPDSAVRRIAASTNSAGFRITSNNIIGLSKAVSKQHWNGEQKQHIKNNDVLKNICCNFLHVNCILCVHGSATPCN